MIGKSIFDTNLLIRLDLSNANTINQSFSKNKSYYSHLCSQLLLYENLVIPTHDFGIIPVIESWIGLDNLEELIRSNSVKFIRRRGLLGYIGNGNAISSLIIQPGKNKPLPWWADAVYSDFEKSAELQITNSFSNFQRGKVKQLLKLVLEKSNELEYENEDFIKNVAEESYIDILKSPNYRSFLFTMNPNLPPGTDLRWLPEVGAKQTRFLSFRNEIKDPVDFVLLLAELNFNIFSSVLIPEADLYVPGGSDFFLQEKIRRAGFENDVLDQFQELLELSRIPDIRPSIENGEIEFSRFWRFRQNNNSQDFRLWLQSIDKSRYEDIPQAFVDTLSHLAKPDSFPLKVLRLAITTAAGLIFGIGGGLAADTIDSFFVDRWLKGYSPNLFLDEIRKLTSD